MKRVALASLLWLAACAESGGGSAPSWAALPASHHGGDATVSGAPAGLPHFAHAPAIDGKLDDAAWQHATTLGPFVDPGGGGADGSPIAPSFARAGWDEEALYLGFVVHDGSPAAPFAREDHDPHLWEQSSAVEVMLQPGDRADNREYFEMQFDTKGAKFDTAWDDYNDPIRETPAGRLFGHQEWSCDARRNAQVAGGVYTIEVAIPWGALRNGDVIHTPSRGDVWKLNLYAFRDGQSVSNAWSPIRGMGNFHFSRRWGRVRFE
jgi:hypothetical protein